MENILLQFGLDYIKTNLGTKEQQEKFMDNLVHIKDILRKKIEEAEKAKLKEQNELEELPNLDNIKK
jgi:hypothetical protein